MAGAQQKLENTHNESRQLCNAAREVKFLSNPCRQSVYALNDEILITLI